MKHQRQSNQVKGQFDLFGGVTGLSQMINPKPNVIEVDGCSVVHVVVSEENDKIPKYREEALIQARRLQPETKSVGRPAWMNPEWQANKRKRINNRR